MKRSGKEWALRIIILMVGLTIAHLGVTLFLLSDLGSGPIIDGFTLLLGSSLGNLDSIALRVLMLIAGCVILAYGMTIVIRSDAGTGPNDLVALVISEKRSWKFSVVRVAVDACFTLAGFLLGGVAGLGTLICMFLVGPVAGFFLPINEKLVEHLIRKYCP